MKTQFFLLPFLFLCGCTWDVTSKYSLGNMKKGEVYTLQEDVFWREYQTTISLHPPQTHHWAPLTIEEYQKNQQNKYFIKDVLPKGTKIKFDGAKRTSGFDHPVDNFFGTITSGKYKDRKEILINDLMVEHGRYKPELSKKYLGVLSIVEGSEDGRQP